MERSYRRAKLPTIRRAPVLPRGPRLYRSTNRMPLGGPGSPPPGFVGGRIRNSASEWVWYWASMRALDPERDPRVPPFRGGRLWRYQDPQMAEFVRQLGSAVADFVYLIGGIPLVVRVQTGYWHLSADSATQAHDRLQKIRLSANTRVVDVYEETFLADPTGRAAVIAVKQTLGLIRRVDPIAAGTARIVRNPAQRR